MVSRQIRWFLRRNPAASSQPVLDVGCGDGMLLEPFGAGSIGLTGELQSANLPVGVSHEILPYPFDRDVQDVLRDAGKPDRFPFVLCLNTLEHVMSPHQHLLMLRRSITDDGSLFLSVPVARPTLLAVLRRTTPTRISRFWGGYKQADHVNFWTPATFDLAAEYAGLEIIDRYYPIASWPKTLLRGITPTYGILCRKIPGWNYKDYGSVAKTLDEDGFLRWK